MTQMTEQGPGMRKLILFGVAVAIPLAAVALYFAIFDQPSLPPRSAQVPADASASAGKPDPGQASLPPNHPPVGGQTGGSQASGEQVSGQPGGGMNVPEGHPQVGGAGRPVRLPDGVKGKWAAVKLRVEEKGGGKPPEIFTVKLGGQLSIPGSTLRVQVGEFLPALQVSGGEITSASNDPTNPAVLVTVSEGGKETFKGWLFSKFPEMQPFEHPKYRITLVEGVPRG
jgi:hypothetical protein